MDDASRFLVGFVLNAAWQVPLMALAVCAAARLLPSAAARHRLLLAALAASLVLPIAGSLGSGRWHPSAGGAMVSLAGGEAGGIAAEVSPTGRTSPRSLAPSPLVATGIGAVYLAGLAVAAMRRGRAWRRAAALRRSALPAPPPEAVRLEAERCRRRLGLGDVVVRLSPVVASPITLGGQRPLILLPADHVASWERAELAGAIGHEMAHVKRRDFAWNAAAELAAVPIAFHPATAWLLRRIRHARELACDALVAERILEARSYARALAALARSLAPVPAYTLGVAAAGILEERVMSLVNGRARRKAGAGACVAASVLLAVVSVVAASYAVAVETGPRASAVIGSWTGRVAQWGDMPALELQIAERGGRLSGRATFYLMHEGPSGLEVGGKDEVNMLEPRFDGRRLSFKVKSPDGKTHSMELRLTGEGQGDFVEVGAGGEVDPSAPNSDLVVKMKRSK